jgi:hypothetical protein
MIKIVKLISGEDLITDATVQDNFLILKNPYRFLMTQEGLASIPLMPFSKDKEYKISMDHVIFMAEPEDEIRNNYNAQHGSGIVIAKNTLINE